MPPCAGGCGTMPPVPKHIYLAVCLRGKRKKKNRLADNNLHTHGLTIELPTKRLSLLYTLPTLRNTHTQRAVALWLSFHIEKRSVPEAQGHGL